MKTSTIARFLFLKFSPRKTYSSLLWIICCFQDILCKKTSLFKSIIKFAIADFQRQNFVVLPVLVAVVESRASEFFFLLGGRDGSVKIWNFNNGNCLRTLTPVDDEEITGIVCTKQRIITVGWSKKVAIYKDSRSDEVCFRDV